MSEQSPEGGDPTLPSYSFQDEDSLQIRLKQVSGVSFPILHAPTSRPLKYLNPEWSEDEYRLHLEQYDIQNDIIFAFFDAIERNLDDVVTRFISGGLVSPDTSNGTGETPLLAAVRSRHGAMVHKLISLGAIVDGYGKSALSCNDRNMIPRERTPLQLAAESGNLAIVKILMEQYGADDSLIAPDGSLALRLAAEGGHREIVQYLPARRGGARKRWLYTHSVEMKRIRSALHGIGEFLKFFCWRVPRFFAWTLPKEVVQATTKKAKETWKRRREISHWVQRRIRELPSRLHRAGVESVKTLKKVPKALKKLMLWVCKVVKAIPQGLTYFALWALTVSKNTCSWFTDLVLQLASLVHTTIVVLFNWCKEIRLQDVWNGLCSVLHSIFVRLPTLLWSLIVDLGKSTHKALKAVFGLVGSCLWYLGKGVLWLLTCVPRKIGNSFQSLFRILAKALDELLVFFGPKKI